MAGKGGDAPARVMYRHIIAPHPGHRQAAVHTGAATPLVLCANRNANVGCYTLCACARACICLSF